MINVLVVTHGEFGAYLIEAAETIVGPQGGGVRAVSISPRTPLPEAKRRLAAAVGALGSPEGVIVFTDMPGGTPGNLSYPLIKDAPRAAMVSGVNLYMLVTAFSRRQDASLDELVERVIAAGQRSICDVRRLVGARSL